MLFQFAYAQESNSNTADSGENASNGADSGENVSNAIDQLFWLFGAELLLIVIVLLILPAVACWIQKSLENNKNLRGLNLPQGSVRACLALLIVGSFVNVLVFGSSVLGDNFDQVITAFGTLAGAVTGFYFAGRSSSTAPGEKTQPDKETQKGGETQTDKEPQSDT